MKNTEKEKVFTILNEDELPRTYKGVDWTNIPMGFVFKTIHTIHKENEFEFIKYVKGTRELHLIYKGNAKVINKDIFYRGGISCLLGKKSNSGVFDYEIGEEVKGVIIKNRYKVNRDLYSPVKRYEITCPKCGFDGGNHYKNGVLVEKYSICERDLKTKKIGCPCCAGDVVVPCINSILVTNKDVCDKFNIPKEVAGRYSKGSHSKIEVLCPDCGEIKEIAICNLCERMTISCKCQDNFSYPEKFMMAFLDECGLDYVFQVTNTKLNWCENYRYDFYIPSLNAIIETHGVQHYEESNRGGRSRTLKEEQDNDKIKKEIALNNGISKYIVIDCRVSDFEWIKNEVLKSQLKDIIDTSIDWCSVFNNSIANIDKKICDRWNNKEQWETAQQIADELGFGVSKIRSTLKKCSMYNLCAYNPKEELIKSGNPIPINVYNPQGDFVGIFESMKAFDRFATDNLGMRFFNGHISKAIKENRPYKKYIFKYSN